MKVTLTFAGDDKGPKTSLKLDLPTKWLDGPMSKVLETFVTNYNKKNTSTPLEEAHVVNRAGISIPNEAIVGQCAVQGDELFIIRGRQNEKPPQLETKSDDEEDVTTLKGIEKAKEKSKHAFDHSKWDKLDLSDDDGVDCHPNIELASWKRIKAQQRAERRAKEEAEIKRLQEKTEKYEAKVKELEGKRDDPAYVEALANAKKYRQRLEEFAQTRKWVAEDVCVPKEDRSIVNKKAPEFPPPEAEKAKVIGPISTDAEFETYDSYVKQHEPLLRKFVAIENSREVTEKFMVEHPEILNQHADGFLLLLCLDTAMRHASTTNDKKTAKVIDAEKKELRRVVRQHLMLNYVLELAKLSKVDDVRAAVKPFFVKTSRQSKEQAEDFEKELEAFVGRIEARAQEKLSKGEKSPLTKKVEETEEDEYEPAGVGPGGLDPTEVLQSLPKEMQEAFVEQDVEKLKKIMSNLPPAEADYHLKRCIDSGLWVVPSSEQVEDNEDDDDELEEEEEELPGTTQ